MYDTANTPSHNHEMKSMGNAGRTGLCRVSRGTPSIGHSLHTSLVVSSLLGPTNHIPDPKFDMDFSKPQENILAGGMEAQVGEHHRSKRIAGARDENRISRAGESRNQRSEVSFQILGAVLLSSRPCPGCPLLPVRLIHGRHSSPSSSSSSSKPGFDPDLGPTLDSQPCCIHRNRELSILRDLKEKLRLLP